MNVTQHPGFFGKIPSKGDFVSRNLPRTFIDPWDQWLQESIASSREQLTNDWLEIYLTTPIWRFALSSGACDDQAWVGVVMPSVDNAGRYFPLSIVSSVSNDCHLLSIADTEDQWFSKAETAALSALDQKNDLESLMQEITDIGAPGRTYNDETKQQPENNQPDVASSDYWRIARSDSATLSASLSPLMEQFIHERFTEFTLWWTNGSDHIEPSILICNKLPPTQGFSALLTGNWDKWGWDSWIGKHPLPEISKNETITVSSPLDN